MTDEIRWTDSEEIGIRLFERFPDTEPMTVRFTDLHMWICTLEGFVDDPKASNEAKLEAIQMAWHEEWEEENG